MIYTLTTNPAVDMNVTADSLSTEHVNRTRDAVYTPNDKGLNVSFTLQHYGIPPVICGFFGGFSGDYITQEAHKRCSVESVEVERITRVNVFVTTPHGEYKFHNAGAPVGRSQQQAMLARLRSVPDLTCLVVSGSLSPCMEGSYYDELLDVVHGRHAEFVLDISHLHLADLVRKKPLLIKANDEEVASIFGLDVHDHKAIVPALFEIHERGAQNILLTLGEDGAYLFSHNQVWRACAAHVPVLSTACAGNASLVGFLSLWLSDHTNVEPALVRGMATGGNVAMSAGLGDFSRVDETAHTIRVERIV